MRAYRGGGPLLQIAELQSGSEKLIAGGKKLAAAGVVNESGGAPPYGPFFVKNAAMFGAAFIALLVGM